ncbi:membrane protein insertion efficiency factor YidD [bacterium]|nr:membrane protein insertion efficiency factor YidD [bacterium]
MLNKIFIYLIKFYRKNISPMFPPSCRFQPTCSKYCLQAFEKHTPLKALMLSFSRVLRCNPLCKGGDDPLR